MQAESQKGVKESAVARYSVNVTPVCPTHHPNISLLCHYLYRVSVVLLSVLFIPVLVYLAKKNGSIFRQTV